MALWIPLALVSVLPAVVLPQSEVVMIEVYLFLGAFTVQVLTLSVLIPTWFGRDIRTELARVSSERLAQVYPGTDVGHAYARFLCRYRAANTVVAVLGLSLLGWLFSYMRQPDWDEGKVSGIVTAYFVLQNLPFMLIAWLLIRFNKTHGRPVPQARRTAILQRRGLFDFVSPWTLALAFLAWLQFAAFMFYIARNPFPGFGGPLLNIGIVTFINLVFASAVYWMIYGRRKGPLETDANRSQITRVVLNSYAWACILVPFFLSLYFARKMLGLETWIPFGRSVSYLILALVMLRLRSLSTPRPGPEVERLDSSPAH